MYEVGIIFVSGEIYGTLGLLLFRRVNSRFIRYRYGVISVILRNIY
jgi:hypothetical protein